MLDFDGLAYDKDPKSIWYWCIPEIVLYFSMYASLLPGVLAKKSYRFEEKIRQEIHDDYEDVDLTEGDFMTSSFIKLEEQFFVMPLMS